MALVLGPSLDYFGGKGKSLGSAQEKGGREGWMEAGKGTDAHGEAMSSLLCVAGNPCRFLFLW